MVCYIFMCVYCYHVLITFCYKVSDSRKKNYKVSVYFFEKLIIVQAFDCYTNLTK